MADAIESRLNDKVWLGGDQPSKEDAEQYAALAANPPRVDSHPQAYAWFNLVAKFTDAVRGAWTEASAAPAGVSDSKFSSRRSWRVSLLLG